MTTTIRIHGASDDLVEVDGDVPGCDEHGFYAVGDPGYLLASDGTILAIAYAADETSCWRVKVERPGTATFTMIREGDDEADDDEHEAARYSDLAELTGEIAWVRWFATDFEAAENYMKLVADPDYVALFAALDTLHGKGYDADDVFKAAIAALPAR